MSTPARIAELTVKHLQESLSATEQAELHAWVQANEDHRRIFDRYTDMDLLSTLYKEDAARMARIEARLNAFTGRKPRKIWTWAAVAALLIGCGAYFLMKLPPLERKRTETADILPGTHKATLTLADGSVIALDSTGERTIGQGIRQQGTQLQYAANATANINTLSTPRGGQFQVKLPDGTKVWLNAASSLRYPSAFTGKDRWVEVTGEAYFEVAKDARKPFRAKLDNGAEVLVLGTRFNINAYTDEPAPKITLLDGAVNVSQAGQSVLLAPMQQAILQNSISVNKKVNADGVLAWKNGAFNFENATVEELMRQLARWYDLEIVYKGKIPQKVFHGGLGRDLKLSQILKVLSLFGIHYTLDGKTLMIE